MLRGGLADGLLLAVRNLAIREDDRLYGSCESGLVVMRLSAKSSRHRGRVRR